MLNESTAVPTLFGIPLNRIVAFAGPHISWLAGIIATWLTTNVHLLATFHVGDNDIANAIVKATVFLMVTSITYAGQHKWLEGFQKWAYQTEQDIAHTPLDFVIPPDAQSSDAQSSVGQPSTPTVPSA